MEVFNGGLMTNVVEFKRIKDKQKEGLHEIVEAIDLENAAVMVVINHDVTEQNPQFQVVTNYDEPGFEEMLMWNVVYEYLQNLMMVVEES